MPCFSVETPTLVFFSPASDSSSSICSPFLFHNLTSYPYFHNFGTLPFVSLSLLSLFFVMFLTRRVGCVCAVYGTVFRIVGSSVRYSPPGLTRLQSLHRKTWMLIVNEPAPSLLVSLSFSHTHTLFCFSFSLSLLHAIPHI